jgi:hypothetical protein
MRTKYFIYYFFIFIFFVTFHLDIKAHSHSFKKSKKEQQFSLKPYLLPKSHPLQIPLANLFHQPEMFHSHIHFSHAGFTVIRGNKKTKLMIGAHPSIPLHLIKKFPNAIPQSSQLKNFIKRIQGAKVLRSYIQKHNFKHLVVPEKWLYKLPKNFPSHSYVLIVEKIDIYDDWDDRKGETRDLYYNMNKEVLTELCIILHDVGGCDSLPRNLPFTRSGKIAFIDTEEVGTTKTIKQFHRDTIPMLNKELQDYAIALWEQLDEQARNRR